MKNRYPTWNPGKWRHGPKPAVPWFNFDPHQCRYLNHAQAGASWLTSVRSSGLLPGPVTFSPRAEVTWYPTSSKRTPEGENGGWGGERGGRGGGGSPKTLSKPLLRPYLGLSLPLPSLPPNSHKPCYLNNEKPAGESESNPGTKTVNPYQPSSTRLG